MPVLVILNKSLKYSDTIMNNEFVFLGNLREQKVPVIDWISNTSWNYFYSVTKTNIFQICRNFIPEELLLLVVCHVLLSSGAFKWLWSSYLSWQLFRRIFIINILKTCKFNIWFGGMRYTRSFSCIILLIQIWVCWNSDSPCI